MSFNSVQPSCPPSARLFHEVGPSPLSAPAPDAKMKFAVRTWLAAAVALALVATVAAAPRPESTVEDVAPVSRGVDGGLTTQAIWYVIAMKESAKWEGSG